MLQFAPPKPVEIPPPEDDDDLSRDFEGGPECLS
jgi:hypothetical protein